MAIGKHIALGLAMLLTTAAPAFAQPEPQPEPQLTKEEEFWFSTPRRRAATAAQLVAAQDPLIVAAMRSKTLTELVWGDLELFSDTAPTLTADHLDLIRDRRPLPDLRGKADDEISRADRAMYAAYNEAVVNSFRYPLEAFKKSAQDHVHLKFAHLYSEPDLHRGKVVTVKGRLVRVRKKEATLPAQENGVKYIYEGWLHGETRGSHPFCIIFTVLPEDLSIAETMNRNATFYGYFVTKFKYRALKEDLETPLLIGPTVVLSASPPRPEITPFPVFALIGVGIVLTGIVTGMIIISWWFRRGDSKIQAQLADLHHRRVRDMMEESSQWRDDPGDKT